jgi:hypothetical protein
VSGFSVLVAGAMLLAPAAAPAPAPEKSDHVAAYLTGFGIGATAPPGFRGDTASAANFRASIVFYPLNETAEHATALIRVRVGRKLDEDTTKDLDFDMKDYMKRFPTVEFTALDASHPTYRVFAREFTVPAKFYEYVAYLNPGEGDPHLLSVSMNTNLKPASYAQLAAFRAVIGSLSLLPGKD